MHFRLLSLCKDLCLFTFPLYLSDRQKSNLQHILNHRIDHSHHGFAWGPQIWVGIDFDQPRPKIFIYYKIIPKQLKAACALIGIEIVFVGQVCIDDDVTYPREEMLLIAKPFVRILFAEILIQCIQSQGVPFLMLAVIGVVLLEALVGQMHKSIVVIKAVIV